MSKKQLSKEEVIHIAKLANLPLQSNEVAKFQRQLNEILTYIDKLNELDTKNVKPTSHIGGSKNIFKEDMVEISLSQKETLSTGKKQAKGMFKIEAILDKE